jgi:hypothetical protein
MTTIEVTLDFIEELRQSKKLFKIIDLKPIDITYKLPIIGPEYHIKNPLKIRLTHADFIRYCNDFPFKELNMIVAGGLVQQFLDASGYYEINSDIDIFIIGRENAMERLIKGLEFIGFDNIYITKNCITAYEDGKIFQFILKWYDSIIDVLNDFDLGSSMGAFDGKQFYFNAEGKFSFESKHNIINLKKCRYSYKNRIQKYMTRGYDILHAELVENNSFDVTHIENDDSFSAYEACVKYENPQLIDRYNLDALLNCKNRFCMSTSIEEIKTGTVQLKLNDNMFGNFDKLLNMPLLKQYYTIEEIAQMVINEKISIAKFKHLLVGKQIEIKILDGNIDKLSTPDMTPEEFYGPDYLYFGKDIKRAN